MNNQINTKTLKAHLKLPGYEKLFKCRHWRPNEIEQGKYRPLFLLDGTTFKFPANQVFYSINWNCGKIERTSVGDSLSPRFNSDGTLYQD